MLSRVKPRKVPERDPRAEGLVARDNPGRWESIFRIHRVLRKSLTRGRGGVSRKTGEEIKGGLECFALIFDLLSFSQSSPEAMECGTK